MALINTTTTGILGTTVYGDGAGALTVQKDGVTQAIVTNIPVFSAYQAPSTNQTVNYNTYTKITLNAKEYDALNNFDTTNSRFVAPVAGYYSFSGGLQSNANDNWMHLLFYKNGGGTESTVKTVFYSYPATLQNCYGTCVFYLAVNDYVEMYWRQGHSPSTYLSSGQTNCYFQGFLVKAV